MSEGHKNAKDVRQAKLEAALKENLKRRKAQARARKSPAPEEGASKALPSRPSGAKEGL